ncbi:unnamed protein product [Peniophora sp. CBMAI 1063]|nr:unnamed protein product [Peniophora sp. CBMAI 1063]
MTHPHFTLAQDDYDDGDELGELMSVGASNGSGDSRVVRRRSSKACDQCRKSKCKCERSAPGEPCKACIMLGTPCTSLGPSRKRGPPKGYIDAIEARLHQTEALVGILLAVDDMRAKSLLDDLAEDPLAKEIIRRVDASAYGVRGRARANEGVGKPEAKTKAMLEQDADLPAGHPSHPSNEWQDAMTIKLNSLAKSRGQTVTENEPDGARERVAKQLPVVVSVTQPTPSEQPRRRRRIGSRSRTRSRSDSRSPPTPDESTDEDGALAAEVGQLSLNEESELRFHGKASGLHLLGVKDRSDGRNEGGIWRFPKSGVWPPLPNGLAPVEREEALPISLPDAQSQEGLLELYFTYVHPSLPVLHKQAFLDDFRLGQVGTPPVMSSSSPPAPGSSPGSSTGNVGKRRTFVSRLLLLVIFSIGARFQSHHAPGAAQHAPGPGALWPAGEEYFEAAKTLLARGATYVSPRVSTCQALLLMAYREIGIGAMAHAWLYLGMAIRMAHDLGMHKAAERWSRKDAGLFTPTELEERRRIWSACVIMDKYVSAYIGRPVYIHERDYDAEPPSAQEPEEMEEWRSKPSTALVFDPDDHEGHPIPTYAVPGRVLSCYSAARALANITGRVIHQLYSIRTGPGRVAESARIEEALDKWFMDLPAHLRIDATAAATASTLPPPQILSLHLSYWVTVILLHRPFMGTNDHKAGSGKNDDKENGHVPKAHSQRNYDLCVRAANHIASIITGWRTHFCIRRAPVWLCYNVFTAGIMHVNALEAHPDDPQAQRGLITCMDVLMKLDTVWPAAGRAWELLRGSKAGIALHGPIAGSIPAAPSNITTQMHRKRLSVKRSADVFVSDESEQPYSPSGVEPRGQSSLAYGHTLSQQNHASPTLPQGPSGGAFFGPSSLPSAGSSSSYERWSGSDQSSAGPSSNGFVSGLSTSGLPPQYSTGFPPEHRMQPPAPAHRAPPGRYPQFWNEFPPLGPQLQPTSYPPQREHRGSMSGADALADIVGNHGAPPHGIFYGLPGTALPDDVGGEYYNGASRSELAPSTTLSTSLLGSVAIT